MISAPAPPFAPVSLALYTPQAHPNPSIQPFVDVAIGPPEVSAPALGPSVESSDDLSHRPSIGVPLHGFLGGTYLDN